WSSVQPSRSSAHRSMGAANVEGALLDSPGRPHCPSIPLPSLRNLWDRELHPPPNSGRCHGCVSRAPTARWWPGIICWRSCQWVPRDGGCTEPCASRREGVDHFVHPRHPPHAGKHQVHTDLMLLHRGRGAAISYYHAIVVLVPRVPQGAFHHARRRVPGENQRGNAEPAQIHPEVRGVERTGGVLGHHHLLGLWG